MTAVAVAAAAEMGAAPVILREKPKHTRFRRGKCRFSYRKVRVQACRKTRQEHPHQVAFREELIMSISTRRSELIRLH